MSADSFMTTHLPIAALIDTAVAAPVSAPASSAPSSSMRLNTAILIASLILGATNAPAQAAEEMPTAQSTEEAPVELPPYPKEENLQSFFVSPTATHTFMIDLPSVSISKDGVIRYTLVSKSRTGALNISHEGIRCRTQDRKSYAFGRTNGDWVRSRSDEWSLINAAAANRQYAALANDYFCQGRTVRGDRNEIASRLRSAQTSQAFGN